MSDTITARYIATHAAARPFSRPAGRCTTCGRDAHYPGNVAPDGHPYTAPASMFDALTNAELRRLMNALVSPEHGAGANRMASLLGQATRYSEQDTPAGMLAGHYAAISDEISALHGEVFETAMARHAAELAALGVRHEMVTA